MKRFLPLTIILVGILVCLSTIHGQMPAERALRNMKTAEGLEVSLFAAEPDLVNPTAMDVDSEGRVWVTEAANYRLFKNPLSRREGDRIRILEDTNGDGRCDKATTYYQDASLQAPLGIAVLGRRVYVCQSPDLFYLEDTDGDGVADKKTVVLTGFKGVDHDHAIHGVIFGPDGHLYLSNGDQGLDVTDRQGNRIRVGPNAPHMAASVLRTDLEGKSLELLAEGLRNPFEPAVDSLGNVFISDNDDDGNEQCRIVFVMEGGNYGYWPRRRGDRRLDAVHWNEDAPGVVPKILKTGFGSPTGMMFYEGTLLPERFRRTLIHADAGPGVVRSYPVRPSGASFSAEIQTILSCPGDKWFRPIDVAAAPDGSLFVADWYDPGVGGHNLRDFSRGRVYRVAPTGSRYQVQKPDLSSATAAVSALGSPNQATRFLAFQALDENKSDQARQILEPLARKGDDALRARALWLAGSWGEPGRALALETTRDPRPEFRIQALRILAAPGAESLRAAHWLLEDSDPGVRRELLLRLQHSKAEWASDWILKLAERFDGQDRFYREALGIAMRGHESRYFSEIVKRFGSGWDKRFVELAFQLHPPEAVQMAGEVLADPGRPVEERLDALNIVAAGQNDMAVDRMLGQLREDTPRPIILAALQFLGRDAGSGGASARLDPRLRDFLKTALQSAELRSGAERLIRELRLTEFIPQLMETAKNRQNSRESRIAAIETMRQLQSPLPLDPLRMLLGDPDRSVAIAAARAMSALNTDDAQQTLQGILSKPSVPGDLRREVVRLLGASKSGALVLLQMAEQGKLAQDLVLEASTVTNASPHENIRLMAQQLLPLPKTRTGKPLAPLPVLIQMKGDVPRGKTIFHSTDGPQCYRCHKIAGEGRDVGPDLSRIGGKLAREAMLESILNPSAAVSHEYQVWLVRTRSQGYLDGYIRSETQDAMELVDSNGNTIRIQASDIVSRTKSATSLMPTGLSSGMTTQQLVDLVAYLSTLK